MMDVCNKFKGERKKYIVLALLWNINLRVNYNRVFVGTVKIALHMYKLV